MTEKWNSKISHSAKAATIIEAKDCEDQTITVYTDESKSENGVGSGVAILLLRNLSLN
jgi:hypothetical protein